MEGENLHARLSVRVVGGLEFQVLDSYNGEPCAIKKTRKTMRRQQKQTQFPEEFGENADQMGEGQVSLSNHSFHLEILVLNRISILENTKSQKSKPDGIRPNVWRRGSHCGTRGQSKTFSSF